MAGSLQDHTRRRGARATGSGASAGRMAAGAIIVVALGLSLVAAKQPMLGLIGFAAACAVVAIARSGAVAVSAFAATLYFEVATLYTGQAASPTKLAGGGLILLAALTLMVRARRAFVGMGAGQDATVQPQAGRAPLPDVAALPSAPGFVVGTQPAGAASAATSLEGTGGEPGWMRSPRLVALGAGFTAWAIASVAWATSIAHVQEFGTRLVTDLLIFLAVPVFLTATRHLRLLAWTLLTCAVGAVVTGQLLGAQLEGRAIGTFADPNEFSAALVPAVALGLMVGESSDRALLRWTARAFAAYGIFGVLASGSRGGLLAVLVAFAVLLMTARGAERVRMGGLVVLAVSAGAAWLLLTPAGDTLRARMTDTGSSGRTDLWKVALYEFEDHPVTGVGLGNYPVLSRRYLDGDIANTDLFLGYPKVVHSTPLEVLAELGAVGFLLYYGFVLGCIATAVRALRRARDLALSGVLIPVGRGVVAATLAVVSTTVFLSGHYFELSWILFGACVAYASMVGRAAAAEVGTVVLEVPVLLGDDQRGSAGATGVFDDED